MHSQNTINSRRYMRHIRIVIIQNRRNTILTKCELRFKVIITGQEEIKKLRQVVKILG